MKELPNVTMICADTVNYGKAIDAIQKSLEQIKPARTIFFTDIPYQTDQFEVVKINTIYSAKEYSEWMYRELGKHHFDTSHILIIQHDGFVLNGDCWDDRLLATDYAGAVWPEKDGYSVGNGGMSIRSVRLHKILAEDTFIRHIHPEDVGIARIYRDYLEKAHNIVFATEELAHKFSFELMEPTQPTFGFHGWHYPPYKPYIVLRRMGALGDVVQIEPVMQWYVEHGYNVVLDSPFFDLFGRHRYPIKRYEQFDKDVIPHKVIDLDMAYEVNPAQLHLKCYYDICGIPEEDRLIKAPQLDHYVSPDRKIFKKYCVIHIDTRETTHRNVHGINWQEVREHLEREGYTVIQIGQAEAEDAGIRFNTVNIPLLNWVISGCDLMIAVDSGPSHIAVALGRKCIIFFGSVNPEYIHPDLSNVIAIKSACPIQQDGCWHHSPSVRGQDCSVDAKRPPCTIISTETVIAAINKHNNGGVA